MAATTPVVTVVKTLLRRRVGNSPLEAEEDMVVEAIIIVAMVMQIMESSVQEGQETNMQYT
eukprot:10094076-Ditylum_brightwellii.AAC.1